MHELTDLTEEQWKIAHNMAIELVKTETDPNEVSKAISYLRAFQNKENIGKNFFIYLSTLAKNGDRVGHSKKTIEYYRNLQSVCSNYLRPYQSQSLEMMQILGWVIRLIRYYKTMPVGEIKLNLDKKLISEPSTFNKIPQEKYTLEQILDATVTAIKGNQVTYQINKTEQKFSNKEPKLSQSLEIKQQVKVQVIELKEDESIKKIKYYSS